MGSHINKDGLFQSDKYPTTPAGKVPLSVKDATAQDLLWEYAQRRRVVDAEFSSDLETCLRAAGFDPTNSRIAKLETALTEAAARLEDARDLIVAELGPDEDDIEAENHFIQRLRDLVAEGKS